jgi:hypothetical protein
VIRTPTEAALVLTGLTRFMAFRWSKVIVMLNEFQLIGQRRKSFIEEINNGLHLYFNGVPRGLAIVLSFSLGRPDNIDFLLNAELRSRADPETILLDELTELDAREFVRDILRAFRRSESPDPYSPFTEEAIEMAVGRICSNGSTTPRAIMHAFRKVTLDFIIDNPSSDTIRAEDVSKWLDELGPSGEGKEDTQE